MRRTTALARRAPLRAVQAPSKQRRPRYTGPTAKVRKLVLDRDRGCVICGHQTVDLQHRRARGMGGTSDPAANKPSNLVCLCRPHHELVETDPWWMARGAEKGWRVAQHRDPRLVRCWTYEGPVFLLDDGTTTFKPPPGFTPQGAAA